MAAASADRNQVKKFAKMLGGKVADEHSRRTESGKHCDEYEIKRMLSDYYYEKMSDVTSEGAVDTLALLLEDFLKASTARTSGERIKREVSWSIDIGSVDVKIDLDEMLASLKEAGKHYDLRQCMDVIADSNSNDNEGSREFQSYIESRQKDPDAPRQRSYPLDQLSKVDVDDPR